MCDINTHLFCVKMLAVFRKRNLLQIQANMTGESDYMVYRPTWWNKWMELLAFLVQIQAKFESWILKHYEWAGMKHFHSSPHECAKCFHQWSKLIILPSVLWKDMKRQWCTINKISHKQTNKTKYPDHFFIDGKQITDQKNISNAIDNNFFQYQSKSNIKPSQTK